MTQRGPWSVKGIDSRAREVAREAAREEGMTLGAYLNRLILEEGITEQDMQSAQLNSSARAAKTAPRASSSPRQAQSDEPSATALDRLTRRIESAEARSTLAITGIDQSVVGLLSRLENTEHNQQAMGGHFEGVMDDIQKTYDALDIKVKKIEADDSSASNLRALKALEDALGKLASHVYEENELVGEETSAIKARLETGLTDLNNRMGNIDAQIEDKLETATANFQQAISEAELRTEGTSKHLAERFSAVELDVSEKLTHVSQMSATMDGVHADVTTSLDNLNDQLGVMQERLSRAETLTDKAMHGLEARLESLDTRLANVQVFADEDADKATLGQFEERFESLSDDLRQLVASTRAELAQEIEAAAKSVDTEVLSRLEGAIGNLTGRLDASEDLHAQTMEMVGDTVSRVTESVDQRLSATQEQQARVIEQVGQQVTRISNGFDERMTSYNDGPSAKAETDALREEIIRFTNTLDERLEYLETREEDTFDKVGSEVEKLADRLDRRVTESEKRSAAAIEQVGEQVAGVAQRIENRQSEALRALSAKMDGTQKRQDQRLTSALGTVSDRLERMQEQSLNAMSPVQKAISALAQRIEAIEDFSAPPYAERGQTPTIPDMVAPTKIDTSIAAEPVSTQFDAPDMRPAEETGKPAPSPSSDDPILAGYLDPDFVSDESDFTDTKLMASDLDVDISGLETSLDALEAKSLPGTEGNAFEPGFQSWSEDANAVLDDTLGPQAQTETPNQYYNDLPPPLEAYADQDIFEDKVDQNVADDIFETTPSTDLPTLGAETDKLNAFEASSNLPGASSPASGTNDLINKARQAAKAAAEETKPSNARSNKKKASGDGAKGGNLKKAGLALAAASIVGTAGVLYLRNQSSAPELSFDAQTTATTPTSALAANPAPEPTDLDSSNASTTPVSTDSESITTSQTISAAVTVTPTTESDPEDDTVALPITAPKPLETTQAATPEPTQASVTSAINRDQLLAAQPIAKTISLGAAAQQGNPVAQFQSGMADLRGGSLSTGAEWLRKAAAQNMPVAQHQLAILHENGTGTTRDLVEARRWHGTAAQGGNVEAMFDFATYNVNGEGGAVNSQVAAEWFRKAAEFGHTDSQYNLAQLYTQGSGVSPSQVEAYYWFSLAAKGGDADASGLAQEMLADGAISQDAAAQVESRVASWTPAVANSAANGRFPPQAWDSNGGSPTLAIQTVLSALGYDIGTPDGVMGNQTRAAIRAFEQSAGMPATGEVSDRLIDVLNVTLEMTREQI